MFTLPMLLTLWFLAGVSFVGGIVMFWRTKKWPWLTAGYLLTGLLAVAIPLKILVPATNLFGMILLTVFWPIWWGQTLFGYSVLDWFPESFWAYFFNF